MTRPIADSWKFFLKETGHPDDAHSKAVYYSAWAHATSIYSIALNQKGPEALVALFEAAAHDGLNHISKQDEGAIDEAMRAKQTPPLKPASKTPLSDMWEVFRQEGFAQALDPELLQVLRWVFFTGALHTIEGVTSRQRASESSAQLVAWVKAVFRETKLEMPALCAMLKKCQKADKQ